jgi:hypothetical protein
VSQIRPSKGLIAKFVQRKDLRTAGGVPTRGADNLPYPSQIKSHRHGGFFTFPDLLLEVDLYFQCNELGGWKWQVFEAELDRGPILGRIKAWLRSRRESPHFPYALSRLWPQDHLILKEIASKSAMRSLSDNRQIDQWLG